MSELGARGVTGARFGPIAGAAGIDDQGVVPPVGQPFQLLAQGGTSSGALVAVPHSGRWNPTDAPTLVNSGGWRQIGSNRNVGDIVT